MADDETQVDVRVEIERGVSLEALLLLTQEAINRATDEGRKVISVSHAIDHEDEEDKPFSALIVTETRL